MLSVAYGKSSPVGLGNSWIVMKPDIYRLEFCTFAD